MHYRDQVFYLHKISEFPSRAWSDIPRELNVCTGISTFILEIKETYPSKSFNVVYTFCLSFQHLISSSMMVLFSVLNIFSSSEDEDKNGYVWEKQSESFIGTCQVHSISPEVSWIQVFFWET